MNPETKICQSCKDEFVIEPEDFKFYEKISVPPPTWCPECRMVRRMAWRNERALYKRSCELCKKDVISMYPTSVEFPVYCHDCWWSDNWNPISYGNNYDFSRPFFSQFQDLFCAVPAQGLAYQNAVNSEYINHVANAKNSYLVFGAHDIENVAYAKDAIYTKDSFDISYTSRSELCYETLDCVRCFKVFYSRKSEDCRESTLLLDGRNCSNCIVSSTIRNKTYCIFNRQFTREDYFQKVKELDLGSFKNLEKLKPEFEKHALKYPRRYATIRNSVNVVGDDIFNAKNCYRCFFLTNGAENCKYCVILSEAVKDSYDVVAAAFRGSELLYEVASGIGQRLFFGIRIWNSFDIFLSYDCHGSNNLFGCIGLRNKSYCILNKQYTKEEYEKLVPRIIEHMNQMPYIDQKGRVYKYGEFFPPELSPFAYNETIAQEYFPLTREEALEQGYSWKDPEPRNYHISMYTTPPPEGRGSPHEMRRQIPDHIKDATDDIVGQ
ncbi:MAG: hypothetical protein Q8R12_03190, partial [bacterium]|nr:hypothetical protein [bacterium]